MLHFESNVRAKSIDTLLGATGFRAGSESRGLALSLLLTLS